MFNAQTPVELQLTDYTCSVGATCWCLRSLSVDVSQQALQALMVPNLVSPDDGLLDSSGATIAQLLRDRFGLAATNAVNVSFDDVAARAGRQAIALGGHRWYVDDSGHATGHWVAVRGFDGQRLVLANPGGTGPRFGQQWLDRDGFNQRGAFSAVWIGSATGAGANTNTLTFRVANTDGQGAVLREQPDPGANRLGAAAEGASVTGGEHAWRQVTDATGRQGWVANELLAQTPDGFRVANTDGQGASLRAQPDTSATRTSVLAEGTSVSGSEHAWRQVTDTNGVHGWMADEFLVRQV